jgi:glycosyltransferase involved in cell wall biosynthesis
MRILLAGCYMPDERQGSPKVLLRLGAEFRELGHHVDYLLLDSLPAWARSARLSWLLFPVLVLMRVLRAGRKRTRYDVVDVSGGDGWLLGVFRRALKVRSRLVCRSHGWEHEAYRIAATPSAPWRGWIFRMVRLPMVASWARDADVIVVGSSPGRVYAVRAGWQPTERVFAVPCGVDRRYLSADSVQRGRGILFVGSWIERKGISVLSDAYELVCSREACIPMSIVGFGCAPRQVLERFRSGLRSSIRADDTLRLADQTRVAREYETHDLLVFPSWYEGFGMVFLEAMAAGLPVIATPVGGVVDIVRDGENGVMVPVGDPDALATAMLDLWRNPERRTRLGAAARETARRYTWGDVARHTVRCYEAATLLPRAVVEDRTPAGLSLDRQETQ